LSDATSASFVLIRPRTLGDILNETFVLYARHLGTFAVIAVAVAVPIDLLLFGVLGQQLWSDYGDDLPFGVELGQYLVPLLLTTPLITAGHVHAVMQIAAGERPSAAASLRAAGRALPRVAVALVLLSVLSTLGLLLLIVPGVYLWIRWFVAPQAVVTEELEPNAGLHRSWDLVTGNWWRVFGIYLVVALIAAVAGGIFVVPLEILASVTDWAQLSLLGTLISDPIFLSFQALAGTLLYFDLRSRSPSG
jgi:hypothetical protein